MTREEIAEMLTPCSDARCILAPQPRGPGMYTQGGCMHIKERGPGMTKLLKALGSEIARLRALPVLATCGECGHLAHYLGTGPSFCGNPHARGNERGLTYIAADDAPPSWCPLRGGER